MLPLASVLTVSSSVSNACQYPRLLATSEHLRLTSQMPQRSNAALATTRHCINHLAKQRTMSAKENITNRRYFTICPLKIIIAASVDSKNIVWLVTDVRFTDIQLFSMTLCVKDIVLTSLYVYKFLLFYLNLTPLLLSLDIVCNFLLYYDTFYDDLL